MINFTQEQENYINSPITEHIYLEACPGSGKTEVVAAKVSKEMEQWALFPCGMAILSFANSATDVLKDRIAKHNRQSASFFPHFIGTFDSFILKNIVSPIAHEITGFSGKDGDYSIRIVESSSPIFIKTKYQYAKRGHQYANQYDYDQATNKFVFSNPDKDFERNLNSMLLETWQNDDLKETKKRFLKAGFATYQDIEHLAIKLLTENISKTYVELIAQKFPLLIIDECQDLSMEQLIILGKLADIGVKLHLIGDLNQAIYGFRNADPQKVNDFITEIQATKLLLTKNFRSGQQIVDLCCSLVPSGQITGQDNHGQYNCKVIEYNSCPTEVIPIFKQLTQEHQNCVIVARGHSILNKFLSSENKLNAVESLALAIVLFDENDLHKLKRSLTLFSEYLRDYFMDSESVKPNSFNCPESISSSLQWRKFLFAALSHLVRKGLGDVDKDWKPWCKLLKDEMQILSKESFVDNEIAELLVKLENVNHSSPKGKGDKKLTHTLQLKPPKEEKLRLETIHQVKGETHDATMLISSERSGKESHWKDWIKDPSSEAARLAYVACSRPKHLLILAVKKLNKEERCKLISLGFSIEGNPAPNL